MFQANIVKFGTEDNTQGILVAGPGSLGNTGETTKEFCTGKLNLLKHYGGSRVFE